MNDLIAFYHSLPGEMLTLLAVSAGTTIRALKNERTDVTDGLIAIVVNASIAYGIVWYVDRLGWATMKEVWWSGITAGFLSSYLLGGLETAGQQFREKPIPMLVSWFVEIYDQILSRLKGPKTKGNE